jgi:type III pantothenate kinase
MILAIDAGNTNITFALAAPGALEAEHVWRTATDPRRTAEDYAVWLLALMDRAGLSSQAVRAAVLASVTPECDFALKTLCRRFFGAEPLVADAISLPVAVALPNPSEAGADRLVNALAAIRLYGAPAIVVDFGTATTLDVIDAKGRYAGGVIAPGPHLSLQALHQAAAKLPRVSIARPQRVMGNSTVTAMQSGLYWGYVSMVEGLLARLRQELAFDPAPRIIATGGLARLFHGAAIPFDILDDTLTLKGLLLLAAHGGPPPEAV